jgi:hypothetical protein
VENSVSTFETAARNAKANGALYGRCFSCTPGDLDTAMGQESQELLSKTVKWTEKMYDMRYDPFDDEKNEVLQYVRNNGENGIVYIEYSYKQIGLTDEWLREMYNKIGNPLVVKREILLQRLRGSSDSPFEQEDIEYITQAVHPVKDEIYLQEHFRLDVYEDIVKSIPYILGVDCSTGTNGDNNAITAIDPFQVKPVAEFKCPYIGETKYEKLIIELVRTYMPRAIVVIERNSVGDGIIDHLLNSPIANNLYFDKNRDLVSEKMGQHQDITSMLKHEAEKKKYYGAYTEKQSREDMMAILKRHMYEFKDNFVTKNITEDISRLVKTRGGRIEAGPGFHDDSIMSYLIGMYVYYHGNNLAVFGFVKGSQEIQNQNEGLTFEDIRGSGILPDRDIEILHRQKEVRKENDYGEIMRKAILQSQKDTLELHKKGLITSDLVESTPDGMLEDMDIYDDGTDDLSFFDEMNGF